MWQNVYETINVIILYELGMIMKHTLLFQAHKYRPGVMVQPILA